MKPINLFCIIVISGLGLCNSAVADDLAKIQQSISQQQTKIAEQKKKRAGLQSTLKEQEMQIGQVNTSLKQIELSLSEIRQTIKHTEQEIRRLEKLEAVQKEKLKQQLNSAYRAGINPSLLERLLSEEAKNVDRVTAYYEHINQLRINTIHELRRTQAELKKQRDELKAQQSGHQSQLSEQKKQEQTLKKIKSERESTLRSIDKTLEADQSRLDTLRSNEQALQSQLQQAAKASEQQEQREIAQLEQKKNHEEKRAATEQEKQQIRAGAGLSGKYKMPVSGRILNKFGSPQMGELRWDAIVIEAKAGTAVKAIAAGRVEIAGWLDGYGQIIVINHGKGFSSLYGYNQSISVRTGERVQAGQTIGYVGNSGGQKRAALYFGIRQNGKAVNPLKWVN